MLSKKTIAKKRRQNRVRSKIKGTTNKPRLNVYRSINTTYASLIDDEKGKTIITISSLKDNSKTTKTEKAKKIGEEIAKFAKDKKITTVVFDRNGYKYHGRIKSVAEGAREGGLKF